MAERAHLRRRLRFERLEDRVLLTGANPLWETSVHFSPDYLQSYGGPLKDSQPFGASVQDQGRTVQLHGNTWKAAPMNYRVTQDTILELEFQSDFPGEMQGIGIDNDLSLDATDVWFSLQGRRTSIGVLDYWEPASPQSRKVTIPLGQYYRGLSDYLVFGNGHGEGGTLASSAFSNVRLYEADAAIEQLPLFDYGADAVSGNGSHSTDRGVISITDNAWAALPIHYDPTPRTILQFDVRADRTDAVWAVGFDADLLWEGEFLSAGDPAMERVASEVVEDAWQTYRVRLGDRSSDELRYLTFGQMDVSSAEGSTTDFRKIRLFEDGVLLDGIVTHDGPTGDGSGAQVFEDGRRLDLFGSGWKSIPLDYDVTPDTILELDFYAARPSDLQGIGFDDDGEIGNGSREVVFALNAMQPVFGETAYATHHQRDYQRYVIPVGRFFQGTVNRLVFANHSNVFFSAPESRFRNVRVYEDPHPLTRGDDAKVRQVERYGARANDGLDDSAAIQAALDAGPGVVYVGPGAYSLDRSLVLKDHIQLVMDSGAVLTASSDSNQPLITASGVEDLVVQGGLLMGNTAEQSRDSVNDLIHLTDVTDVTVESVRVTDASGYGLHLQDCNGVVVERVEQWDSGGHGGIALTNCTDAIVDSSVTRDNRGVNLAGQGYGIYVQGIDGVSRNVEIRNHLATGNSNDNLVIFDSEDVRVIGGRFNHSTEDKGAHIQNVRRLLIQGAEFVDNAKHGMMLNASPAGSGYGIDGAIIEGSRFFRNQQDGLHLHGDDVLLTGVVIEQNGGRGIRAAYSTPTQVSIVSSLIKNNQGAAIHADHAANWAIEDSQIFDDQDVQTQTYAVLASADSIDIAIKNSDVVNNRFGAVFPGTVTLTELSDSAFVINMTDSLVGEIHGGIGARDNARGLGYVLYSEQNLYNRLNPPPTEGNAEHLISVVFRSGQWWYDNNSMLSPFQPRASDLLIAEVNFETDTVELLEGMDSVVGGIDTGYGDSDIAFVPNQFGGRPNRGEFGVTGTYVARNRPKQLIGDLHGGIPAIDSATDSGYIMFTVESAFDRFAETPPAEGSSAHLVPVVLARGRWLYDNNSSRTPFSIRDTDLLVAEVDFGGDVVVMLEGVRGIVRGIESGYREGDLVFTPNEFGGKPNEGEFGATGSYLRRNGPAG